MRKTPAFFILLQPGQKKARAGGFSLVEVTLALGILSFAFVSIFGLLPIGLDVSRQAISTTVAGQITQQLTQQALQTDFSGLPDLASASAVDPFYFDDQGGRAANAADADYKAVFAVTPGTNLPAGVATQKLAVVTVCVLNLRSHRTSREEDLIRNPDSQKTPFLVPDNGR